MKVYGIKVELVCVQCSLKQLVEALDAGKDAPDEPVLFEGTMDEHIAQHHPDPAATLIERNDLMTGFSAHQERKRARSIAMSRNARNN